MWNPFSNAPRLFAGFAGGAVGKVLKKASGADGDFVWSDDISGGSVWGSITGTLSNQTDLQSALDGKAALVHTHPAVDISDSTATGRSVITAATQAAARTAIDAAKADVVTVHEAAADPHTQYQRESEKAAASGYASLDAGTKVPTAQLGGAGADNTKFLRGDQTWQVPAGGSADGLGPDGDKGDVTVGGTGTTLTIDNAAVTYAKMQNVAASRLLGNSTGAPAAPAEITLGYAQVFTSGALATSLTSSSAFATATTTISAATYADITGCSLSLVAGTWLIIGQVNIGLANAIIQAFVAITDGANAVISEVSASRPASGTASLVSPFSCNPIAIVSPVGTTTYKLRGARGVTTHTGSWTAMDGNGVNTANHLTNNSDKGTGIFAVRIA